MAEFKRLAHDLASLELNRNVLRKQLKNAAMKVGTMDLSSDDARLVGSALLSLADVP